MHCVHQELKRKNPQKSQKPATKCETLHHNSAALAARFGLLLLRALNLGLAKQSAEKGTDCTTNQKHYSHGNSATSPGPAAGLRRRPRGFRPSAWCPRLGQARRLMGYVHRQRIGWSILELRTLAQPRQTLANVFLVRHSMAFLLHAVAVDV